MISALKRLVANDSSTNTSNPSNQASVNANLSLSNTTPPNKALAQAHLSTTSLLNNGMHMISQSLQKKFSRGVNYNMKIVIRGDCNTGKTCLWLRLQGQPFKEVYETSDEIKVANINWNYKATDDIVKVEIWDVVDRSKKKRNLLQQQKLSGTTSLKLENSTISDSSMTKLPVEASLDAEFIDVYKNANGCILIYDITKQWTWDYIERELPKIPSHIPVLIIGNHRDMHHHRTVDELKCKFFLENLNRGSLGSAVRYTETSMRTGFGLTYLYKFFNIPFLQLQRENLMQQLEINAKETDAICEELQLLEENIENDYENFSQNLNSKRRQQQEENAKDILKNAKSIDEARKLAHEKEITAQAALAAANAQLSEPKKVINNLINKINTKVIQPNNTAPVSMSVTIDPNCKMKNLPNISNSTSNNNLKNNQIQSKTAINFNLEDLPHDDELNKFLDDPQKPVNQIAAQNTNYNEDDEDEDTVSNNPMVAALKENIDSSDEESTKGQSKIKIKPVDLSDDNEEDQKLETLTSNLTLTNKTNESEQPKQNEFIFVNKMSSHNSSSSNISSIGLNNSSNNYQQQQQQASLSISINSENNNNNTNSQNHMNLDSYSTNSMSLVNYDTTSQTSNSLPVLDLDQANNTNNIKLTNDDFEFLEKMSNNEKKTKSSKTSDLKSIKKTSKSSKLSDHDDESSSKIKTKKKKTKTTKESNDESLETNEEKKEKKKSKKSKSKSSKNQSEIINNKDEDDDFEANINIKRDLDYEEL